MAGVAHDLGGRDRQSYLGSWPACSTELVLGQEGYTVKNNNKKYMVSWILQFMLLRRIWSYSCHPLSAEMGGAYDYIQTLNGWYDFF